MLVVLSTGREVEVREKMVEDHPGGVVSALHTMDVNSEEEMAEVDAVQDDDPRVQRQRGSWPRARRSGSGWVSVSVGVIEIGLFSGASVLNVIAEGDGDEGV